MPLTGTQAASLQPLIQKSDMTYLGAFALPPGNAGGSRFAYGGHALTPYTDPSSGRVTLFLEGHAWYPGWVAQVEVPDTLRRTNHWNSLARATVLQPFRDITDGRLDTVGNYTTFVYGLLPYRGRLIVAASEYYDADGSQVNTHGVCTFDLADPTDLEGFFAMDAVASPRSLGGYMTLIPAEWQEALGGPALSGQCCLSIISNGSSGPAATVFDPDDVGRRNPIPGITLLYYPLSHPLAPGDTQNPLFNLATQIVGVAFPPGSRSVLFIGRHGTGPYCYGTGEECHDPADDSKGTHAYPYQHQIWAYHANDLVEVRHGRLSPWDPQPYATWSLDEMDSTGHARIMGAGFDPASGRLYIAQAYGEEPRIDVYQITVPTPPTLLVTREGGAQIRLRLTAQPGQSFTIEVSTNLLNWNPAMSGTTDGAGHLDHLETSGPGAGHRFFRARATESAGG